MDGGNVERPRVCRSGSRASDGLHQGSTQCGRGAACHGNQTGARTISGSWLGPALLVLCLAMLMAPAGAQNVVAGEWLAPPSSNHKGRTDRVGVTCPRKSRPCGVLHLSAESMCLVPTRASAG